MTRSAHQSTKCVADRKGKNAAQGKTPAKLLVAMTGKASAAETAEGAGVDGGWCFSSGAFVGHVKLMFIRGTEIKPEPPVTPIGMGKSTRGVELAGVDDFAERQLASWMKQAATMPFVGGKKR